MAGMTADWQSFGSAPELISAKCIDKQVDHANRDAVVNDILEALDNSAQPGNRSMALISEHKPATFHRFDAKPEEGVRCTPGSVRRAHAGE